MVKLIRYDQLVKIIFYLLCNQYMKHNRKRMQTNASDPYGSATSVTKYQYQKYIYFYK